MLVNVGINERVKHRVDLSVPSFIPSRFGQTSRGIYIGSLNSQHFFDENALKSSLPVNWGVCDNELQILHHPSTQKYITGPANYVVLITPVWKDDEPERDGWRWEKWGEYIGTRFPKADYLYYEPEIEMIFVYSIYEVNPKYTPLKEDPYGIH